LEHPLDLAPEVRVVSRFDDEPYQPDQAQQPHDPREQEHSIPFLSPLVWFSLDSLSAVARARRQFAVCEVGAL
jgi:hypothetical protein